MLLPVFIIFCYTGLLVVFIIFCYTGSLVVSITLCYNGSLVVSIIFCYTGSLVVFIIFCYTGSLVVSITFCYTSSYYILDQSVIPAFIIFRSVTSVLLRRISSELFWRRKCNIVLSERVIQNFKPESIDQDC